MNTDRLISIGQKLYGTRWKTPLAKAIGYRRETVSRWAAGKQEIPLTAEKILLMLERHPGKIPYKERRPKAVGVIKKIGDSITLIHADAVNVKLEKNVDVILTDPVWPNALEQLIGAHNPYGLFSETIANLSQFLSPNGRIIVHLRCDSDPRFLSAIGSDFPFFRVAWLPYALPSKQGRVLMSSDVAYIFGHPPKSRPGNHLLPGQPHSDFCPSVQPEKKDIKHPCPRNLTHVEWLIEKFTEPTDIILDPFMGSGTTAVAALNRGRDFIGIEIESKYIEEAEKRIGEIYSG